MKELWKQSNRSLEGSMRLNVLLLQQRDLRKAETSLRRLTGGIAFELIVNAIGIALLWSIHRRSHPRSRFVDPAVMLDVYAIGARHRRRTATGGVAGLDYDEPVVAIQKRLEGLRLMRIRTTLGTLLFAPLMWLPLLIVTLRGVFGVDVYAAASATWLTANVLFGLAVIPLAVIVARRYGPRLARFTPMRRFADAIAGESLAQARDSLDAIRRFEES